MPSSASDSNEIDGNTWHEFCPLITVTICVTLFLPTRLAMSARRHELDAGAHDGTVKVDDNVTAARDVSLLSDWRNGVRDVVIMTTLELP